MDTLDKYSLVMSENRSKESRIDCFSEGSIVNSHKPSKKLKTLSFMDKSTTCSKRVNLPKKRLDDSHTISRVPVPRKLRSALKNRYSDPSSSNLTNGISKFETSSTLGNKKPKLDPDEQHHLQTKDEEEAVAGLLALGGNDITHEVNLNIKHSVVTSSKTEDLVQDHMQINDPNESRNRLDVKKDSRKRCSTHVYICRIIKNLKNAKGKTVNLPIEAKTETTTENVTNVGIVLFDDQSSGYGVHSSYFGNPFCDPSQWSRPVFPKEQMWVNQFMYKQPQLGSYLQASFHNALGSKQQQQQQQLGFKMHFDHLPSSRHDENGVLFHVDSPPTLKLALR
ncbi:hypothetical protein QVD17_42042 [Tagetes erecta]|uniref:Uncharacterized protein n=1 Tax=Tagetes erecta TaxID=13708 RepID=A0AAD8JMZ5_TARER|nr:hypothetical protein QVD17_42042 [Tagetes erecta]